MEDARQEQEIQSTARVVNSQYLNAYWCLSTNFGDALTPYLIEKMSGKAAVYTRPSRDVIVYMATGSMLDDDITNTIVWGCGIAWAHDIIREPKEFRAVRGPISRRRVIECGLKCPDVVGDPALLMPSLYNPQRTQEYKIGVIPHYIDLPKAVKHYGNQSDTLVINILDPIEKVIDQVVNCDKILSSSLHGLVVAQAYQKPNRWVQFSDDVIGDGTKFYDFMLSVGMNPYAPINLRDPIDIHGIMKRVNYSDSKIDLKRLLDACPFNDLKISIK